MSDKTHMQQVNLERQPMALSDETLLLDVPVVATALGRRLYAAGLPVTAERAANFVAALTLVGPLTRSRLYCTARALFVTAPVQLEAFDRVFATVFDRSADQAGSPAESGERPPRLEKVSAR